MISVLLDTHALIWTLSDNPRYGRRAKTLSDRALAAGTLGVSAACFWEAAMLARRERIDLQTTPTAWRRLVLELGIIEMPLTGDLAIEAAELPGFHSDPADRFIVATALRESALLITADSRILAWRESLRCHDASR